MGELFIQRTILSHFRHKKKRETIVHIVDNDTVVYSNADSANHSMFGLGIIFSQRWPSVFRNHVCGVAYVERREKFRAAAAAGTVVATLENNEEYSAHRKRFVASIIAN